MPKKRCAWVTALRSLKDGRLVQAGRAEDLYLRPANLFAAGFFSELNVFNGRVRDGAVDTSVGPIAAPGRSDGRRSPSRCERQASASAKARGGIEARIISRRYLGVVELLELAVPGAETPVRARVRCGVLSSKARDIWLTLHSSDVLLFETGNENA